jgi:uncharacterized protein involved in oxidation of intracellular sulfur
MVWREERVSEMKILLILNDAPYGSERPYNALRLAMNLQKEHPDSEIRIFLMADAVTCALPKQNTPQGCYNIERMLNGVIAKGGKVKLCGTCCEARGLKGMELIAGTEISTMNQLSEWVVDSEKVLTF